VRALISAAGGDDAAIRAAIADLGAERAAAVLVDELVTRADLHEIPRFDQREPVVRFTLWLERASIAYQVRCAASGPVHGTVDEPDCDAEIELDLVQLCRAVFGPPGGVARRVTWHQPKDPDALQYQNHVSRVVYRLLRGLEHGSVDLSELALQLGSDKWGLHYYTPHYQRHFAPLRDRCLTVLELGIGGYAYTPGGGSLRMWKRFFPRAMVYGVDIFDKSEVAEQRIQPIQGDLSDPAFLARLGAELGPFDIVIDDASHRSADVIKAFRALFDHVRPGGLYVIEDLQTSYWPEFGGTSERLDDPATSMGLLKQLVDGLNHEEFGRDPIEAEKTLVGMHFYHNMAVLERGVNAEGTIPPWVNATWE